MTSSRVSHPKGAKTVFGRLKRMYGAPAKQPVEVDSIEQIVLAILAYNEPLSKAQTVLRKLKGYYVDFNEFRIARSGKLLAQMGTTLADSSAKAKRILTVLKSIFNRENSFDLAFLKAKSKQDLEAYFSEIAGSDNYLVSSVILHCCGRQAFPLDEKMLEACKELELAQGPVNAENMQAYLERQLRSAESYAFCCLLKQHSTRNASVSKAKKTSKDKAEAKPKKVKSSAAKKSVKKTASVKKSKTKTKSKKKAVTKQAKSKKVSKK